MIGILKYGIFSQGINVIPTGFPVVGLTHYWNLDEISGTVIIDDVTSINGTMSNTAMRVVGKNGNGIDTYTQATDEYVNTNQVINTDDVKTINFWFKMPATGVISVPIGTRDGSGGYNTIMNSSANRFQHTFFGIVDASVSHTYSIGTWDMYTILDRGSFVEFYVNAVSIGSVMVGTTRYNSNATLILNGTRNGSATIVPYPTIVDEIAMWNRNLTQAELTTLYNNGAGLFYELEFPDNGLTSYWRFDETSGSTINDVFNYANGTITTGSMVDTGINNYCWNNTSQNNYGIQCGNQYRFNTNNTFTLNTWVKFQSTTGFDMFFSNQSVGNITGWFFDLNNSGKPEFQLIGSGGFISIAATSPNPVLNTNDWFMLTCTYDGSGNANGVKIYINSINQVLNTNSNSFSGTITYDANFCVGGYSRGGGLSHRNFMDESAIWNRVLSQTEISMIYNNGNGLFY